MSQVAIEKIDGKKTTVVPILDELRALSARIRQRAFEIFERRGRGDGFEMDDWLNAERDLLRIPESELVEQNDGFTIRVNAPGFNADDVHVTVMPDALIVKASSTHNHDESEGKVRFCEFGQRTLFRRFNLPEPVNLDKVTADLDQGVLQIRALKAKQWDGQKPQATAA